MDISHKLLQGLTAKLEKKLTRGTIGNAAEWAGKYRWIPVTDTEHPNYKKWINAINEEEKRKIHVPKNNVLFNFKHHPWAYEMHTCNDEQIVGQKSAQMGYTEVCMNRAFYANDILGETVLYVLPTKSNASDFSNGRFDPALEASPHLQGLYSDVKNVGLKRAGAASLYIRGSGSRSELKSIPASKMFFDEVDEMDTTQIVLAFERMMGQDFVQSFLISTPSYDNVGINYFFKDSSQDHFFFRCPHCGKFITMVFDIEDESKSSLVITGDDPSSKEVLKSFYKCYECQGVLKHEEKPNYINLDNCQWVPKYSDRHIRGFHVNQFNSHARAAKPSNMAITFLRSRTSPEEEQEFYNNKLGITHAVEGARITDKMIANCMGGHVMLESASPKNRIVTMGIDPGHSTHYYEICEYIIDNNSPIKDINLLTKARLIKCGIAYSFDEFPKLYQQYKVNYAVIDAQPQKELSLRFCQKVQNAKYCYYTDGLRTRKDMRFAENDPDDYMLTVDRTLWLDISLGRFKSGRILLPKDCPTLYKDHIKTNIRAYHKDKNGNPVGKYVKGEKERDDYAHARNYCEIALPFAVSLLHHRNISTIL